MFVDTIGGGKVIWRPSWIELLRIKYGNEVRDTSLEKKNML